MKPADLSLVSYSLLAALCLTPASAPARTVNRIIATVDGEPITLYELEQFAASDVRIRQAAAVDQAAVLEALVTQRIIEEEVKKQGVVIRDEDIDRYIQGIRERNQLTEEQLAEALQRQGMTLDAYRTQIREELQRAQLINREIRGKVNVTPEDVERYYQAHLSDYEQPAEITVSHIVLQVPPDATPGQVDAVLQRAGEIHAELDAGGDFAELARKYSQDPSAESGGSLGSFRTGELLDELAQATRELQPGEYSEPVRTEIGVHIIRLDARSSETHQSLEDLSTQIEEQLYSEALEERYSRWLRDDLRKRHHVEILP